MKYQVKKYILLGASWACSCISFIKCGKISGIISSNISSALPSPSGIRYTYIRLFYFIPQLLGAVFFSFLFLVFVQFISIDLEFTVLSSSVSSLLMSILKTFFISFIVFFSFSISFWLITVISISLLKFFHLFMHFVLIFY